MAALWNIHQIRLLPLLSDEVLNHSEQLILRLFKSAILLTVATFLVRIVFSEWETLEDTVWGVMYSIRSQRNYFHERVLQYRTFFLVYCITINYVFLIRYNLYLGNCINFLSFYDSKFPASVIIIKVCFICFYFGNCFSQTIDKLLLLILVPRTLMVFIKDIIESACLCLPFYGNV